mgnify:CR=1 FL=1
MPFSFLIVASALYAIGGLFMKLSSGMSRPAPTVAFLMLFVGGAVFQALGMRRTDLVVSYIFVLGAEALVAVLSLLVRRPVKISLTMEEQFFTITKHASTFRIKSGVTQDGRILARECDFSLVPGESRRAGGRDDDGHFLFLSE